MRKIPLAYLITFTCYGTWLHGDDRGSVNNNHNQFDMPFIEADTVWHKAMQKKMKEPPLFLTDEQRTLVAVVIAEVCVFRNWLLHECNARTNHVHSVVSGSAAPDKIMKGFKAYAPGGCVSRRNWIIIVPYGRKAEVQDIYGRKHRSPPR